MRPDPNSESLADRYTFGDREHLALRMVPFIARQDAPLVLTPDENHFADQDEEPTASATQTVREWFLRTLHPEGWHDLRALDLSAPADKQVKDTALLPVDNLDAVERWLTTYQRWHLYVGVAPRDGHGRSAQHCLPLRAVWVEIDFKDVPEVEARARLAAFPLRPSIVIRSGGGLHVYWHLEQPLLPDARARALLRSLAIELSGDIKAAEVVRILRVPGTLNHKYNPPRLVEVETHEFEHTVTLDQLLTVLPPLVVRDEPEQPPVEHTLSVSQRQQMAAAWLMTQNAAVEGQHGDAQTFMVCAAVSRGFVLGDGVDAVTALADWNRRCRPPWSDRELRRKLHNGFEYGDERIGVRLLRHSADLIIRRASDVPDEPSVRLFGGRLERGNFGPLVGPGDVGKGMMLADAIARLTTGRAFPGDDDKCRTPIGVLLCVTEDSEGKVKSRIRTAGGNLDLVYFIGGPEVTVGGLTMPSNMMLDDDAAKVVKAAKDYKAGVLVLETTIEHFGDRAGKKRINTFVDADVRRALAPVRAICKETPLFGLGALHTRKSLDGSLTDSIGGSVAFNNVGRGTLHILQDPKTAETERDEMVRLLCSSKANYLRRLPPTLRFRIQSWDTTTDMRCACPFNDCPHEGRIVWLEGDELFDARKAEDIWRELRVVKKQRADLTVVEAEDFLRRMLAPGVALLTPAEIEKRAKAEGISPAAIKRARKSLGVVPIKDNEFPANVIGWKLPEIEM